MMLSAVHEQHQWVGTGLDGVEDSTRLNEGIRSKGGVKGRRVETTKSGCRIGHHAKAPLTKLTILMSPDTSPGLKEAWTGRALPLVQKKETEVSKRGCCVRWNEVVACIRSQLLHP